MTNGPSPTRRRGRMLRLMEGFIGLVALSAGAFLFVGANLVAIALMTGGSGEESVSGDRP